MTDSGTTMYSEGSDLIVLSGVCREYVTPGGGVVRAADHVSLVIGAGESVGLVGASGSGKSTLLHLIGSMDAPDEGNILARGVELTELDSRGRADYRSRIGFIFQQFHLIDSLTLAQNVAAPLVGRAPKRDHRERALAALEKVGLADRADSYPWQLSGGQQQRVAIARALVVEPWLILADEPTGNLDSTNSRRIMDLLMELQTDEGLTLIVATHDPAIAACLDRVITIADGVATENSNSKSEDRESAPSTSPVPTPRLAFPCGKRGRHKAHPDDARNVSDGVG